MAKFQHGMNFLYRLGWTLARAHYCIYHQLKVVGLENLPPSGGAVLAVNHVSHLDPPAVGAACPRAIRWVAKQELWNSRFLGWYFNAVGIIPIRRGSSSGGAMLDHAAQAIKDGSLVTLFPEGTRSKTGYPGKARSGVCVLAAMTGAPVIPVRISGSYDCMPRKTKIPRPGLIQVAYGEPITWAPGELDTENRKQMVSEAQRILEIIVSLPGWHPKKAKVPEETGTDKATPSPESKPE